MSASNWEVGQHPAVSDGWIVRPVLFGSRAYALPASEGGHIVLRSKEDAHLIAAAPDLLGALKEAVEDLEVTLRWSYGWECSEDELLGPARAAIAKAEGK